MDPSLKPLLTRCASAELTVCALTRGGKKPTESGWAVNAFSVLYFSPEPLPGDERKPTYETKTPESSPDARHQLFVARTRLSIEEAIPLCEFDGHFTDPRAPAGFAPIASPGTWVGPIFVEENEETIRSCVPPSPRAFWLKECWQPAGALQTEIGAKTVAWLQSRVNALLGVRLAARRERIGNFLVVLPETRARLRIQPSRTKDLVGVEVECEDGGPTDLLLVARGSRDRRMRSAVARRGGPGLHVLPMLTSVDYREIELYDGTSGLILDRHAGVPMREIAMNLNMLTTHLDLHANFVRQDGTPDGEPVHVQTDWGVNHGSSVGGRPEWERTLDEVRAEEQREALRASEQFFVYRGKSGDRERAVNDIRKILHARVDEYVKIWDPYFGAREAFEFLFYVIEPTTPITVLSSFEATDDEQACHRVAKQSANGGATLSLSEWKRRQMQDVMKMLREPRQGTPGLTALTVKTGGTAFHDRFIMTNGRCWQLGCSFNQIGRVMSTIVEFPYPAMIEHEFDEALKSATDL